MTPLEQKLEQLKLTTMSQHLEATLKEAAAKNLSFAALLESLADLELEARNLSLPVPQVSSAKQEPHPPPPRPQLPARRHQRHPNRQSRHRENLSSSPW